MIEVLEAITKKNLHTIPQIVKETGFGEEFVEYAIDYWEKKGKLSKYSYTSQSCESCPFKGKCKVCKF